MSKGKSIKAAKAKTDGAKKRGRATAGRGVGVLHDLDEEELDEVSRCDGCPNVLTLCFFPLLCPGVSTPPPKDWVSTIGTAVVKYCPPVLLCDRRTLCSTLLLQNVCFDRGSQGNIHCHSQHNNATLHGLLLFLSDSEPCYSSPSLTQSFGTLRVVFTVWQAFYSPPPPK